MLKRLILSFVLVVFATIAVMLWVAQQTTGYEVRAFMFRGGMVGLDQLASDLENYYNQHQTWSGVESTITLGQGKGKQMGMGMGQGRMMSQQLLLADAGGNIVFNSGQDGLGKLSAEQQKNAIELHSSSNALVGYLYTEGGMTVNPAVSNNLINRLTKAAWYAAGVSGFLALILALLLSFSLLHPINELTSAAKAMAGGDLSQRVDIKGKDELGTLGEAFNHMASSIETAEQNRRSMTFDIAHELRTPLAVQRANLEALQDGIYPLTPENLQPILDQTNLLTRLVSDLRTLASAESGELKLNPVEIDTADLLEGLCDQYISSAASRNIELVLDIPERKSCPHIQADPDRLAQIFHNLIANALRYTPDGGKIYLRETCSEGKLKFQIQDTGPGIPEDALPHVFERFYRADSSRSRDEGGSGLGLAIARQLALAHFGELTAANAPEGGAIFTLVLPSSLIASA